MGENPRVGTELVGKDTGVPKENPAGRIFLLAAALHQQGAGTRVPGVSDAAAERGAVQPGGGPGTPGLLVLLGQQQHEGHGQGTVVEAVHVGVIPLLQAGRAQ